ncbi:Tannase/feruloyl esterase [Apiospora arundinis]
MDQLMRFLGFGSTTGPGGFISCAAASIPYPTNLPNAEFLSVEANLVTNYTVEIPPGFENSHSAPYAPLPILNFCNVTLIYTHPGLGDKILTQVWLPLGDVDGGNAGHRRRRLLHGLLPLTQAHGVGEGYAVVTTDGGARGADWGDASYIVASPGNVDWTVVHNFGSVALHEAAVIGRAVTESFYRQKVRYAYFTGCSTGGRQAAMLAQRWPEDYDGYLAGAAALRCHDIVVGLAPPALMTELSYTPPPCELRALRRLAMEACDSLDGVVDGLVSEPERCFEAFDPHTRVGESFVCEETGKTLQITKEAAKIAQLAWEGLRDVVEEDAEYGNGAQGSSKLIWGGGVGHQAPITDSPFSWALTTRPFDVTGPEFQQHGPRAVARIVRQARQWYTSALGTFDTDLSGLRESGGKMLMWHGMADEAIPLGNSREYYDAVAARDPKRVDGYLRYFEAPGIAHCGFGGEGNGLWPVSMLEALRAWVEEGKAPEVVPAVSKTAHPETGVRTKRNLCRYPQKAKYDGVGNIADAASFKCL